MTEATVRRCHRQLGIILVWFLAVQGASGLLLAVGSLADAPTLFRVMGPIHYGWDPLGSVYRIILTLATAAQGLSGIIIFSQIRSRMKRG